MNAQIRGNCFQVGSQISAYQIVPQARWKAIGADEEKLGDWLFEDQTPEAKDKCGAFRGWGYNIVVAGGNFGCGGKSNDHPVLALKGGGVELVIAESFNRIFFRNAINLGLSVMICPDISTLCATGDAIECDLSEGIVKNITNGKTLNATPLSPMAMDILSAGGLLNYYNSLRDRPELLFVSK